jgi:hypothetical protein
MLQKSGAELLMAKPLTGKQESIGTPQLEFTLHEIRCDADGDLLYEARAPSQVNYAA